MDEMTNLGKTEALCKQIMNSAYFLKQTPAELVQLRVMLDQISHLVRENVPQLITEVKQLRNQNKRLNAEIALFDLSKQPAQNDTPAA